jgi:regulator of sigma E protease
MITTLSFLVVFSIVVLAHEAGHFLVAKAAGIKVYEFGIGFGPRLFKWLRGGTLYTINLIPFGGMVRLGGLDDTDKEKASPEEQYQAKSWQVRGGVLLAGPIMNFILAFLIFVLLFSIIGVPQDASNVIKAVLSDSPAQKAGWQAGDIITEFNQAKVVKMSSVIKEIHRSRGKRLSFKIKRGTKTFKANLVPKYYPQEKISLIGINLKPGYYKRYTPLKAIKEGSLQTFWATAAMLEGFKQLIKGEVKLSSIAGPVGIARLSGEAASQGVYIFFSFIAFLSINLGIINLLPLPALDGGRVLFIIAEVLFGKKISVEKEQLIHYLGFAFLLALLLMITFQDLHKIFNF